MELGWFQVIPSGYTTIYSIESYLLTAKHTDGLSTQQRNVGRFHRLQTIIHIKVLQHCVDNFMVKVSCIVLSSLSMTKTGTAW